MIKQEAPETLARRIMALAAWEPRAGLENATEYVKIDRRDAAAADASEIAQLKAELAKANACIESMAVRQDMRAMRARALGAYHLANSYAMFADSLRLKVPPSAIIGDGVLSAEIMFDTESDVTIEIGDPEVFPSTELDALEERIAKLEQQENG